MQPNKPNALQNYIQSQLSNGASANSIRTALLAAQWPADSIEVALQTAQQTSQLAPKNSQSKTVSPIPIEKPVGTKKLVKVLV